MLMLHLESRQLPSYILPQDGDAGNPAVKYTLQGIRHRVLNLAVDTLVSPHCNLPYVGSRSVPACYVSGCPTVPSTIANPNYCCEILHIYVALSLRRNEKSFLPASCLFRTPPPSISR